MNLSPRPKSPSSKLLLMAALMFALLPQSITAQQQQRRRVRRNRTEQQQQQQRRPDTKAREAEAARRMEAMELLRETADRARLLDDLFYRARLQTLAADALWAFDVERARSIFRRAWEAATASDKAEQEAVALESGAAAVVPDAAKPSITAARDEVLLKAAARDPALGEAFLKELSKENTDERSAAQSKSPQRRTPWRELDQADGARLTFAFDLLARGESTSAAQLAAPLVNRGVSADLIAFIIALSVKNPSAADRLFGLLLAQARTDPRADANDVLLLSAPVISPEMLVVVDERGSLQFRPLVRAEAEPTPWPPIAGRQRHIFFQTAANLLLKPVAATTGEFGAAQTQQAFALYLAMGRLLPFFESEAAQFVPELRARESALANELEAGRRDMLASHFDLRRGTQERGGDPLRSSFEQLSRASGGAERDRLLVGIVRTAVRNRLWDRARRAATEIENQDSRRAALSYVAVSQISDLARTYADDEENDYENIIKFLNGADVPPLASAWGYAEAAQIAARRKDSNASLQLLNEAERYAARVEARTRQRVSAYAIVAGAAARIDPARAWTLLYEVVKAANQAEDFTGDELSLEIKANETSAPDAYDTFSLTSEAFRFDQIFATMAQQDFAKTVSDARALEGRVPQAFAYIAIARAALEQSRTKR